MKVSSQQLTVRQLFNGRSPISTLKDAADAAFGAEATPIRVAVTSKSRAGHTCEIEAVEPKVYGSDDTEANVFEYRQRRLARTNAFNAVMLIPTGVDCAIGGHAGDATPAARLLANVCDQLILHPNVVNASDVNEQTENSLYVEGSIICRLLMGTAGLRKVRQNRVLLVTENRKDSPKVVDQTINCAEGARATLGMDISDVLVLEQELHMLTGVSDSGRVTGRVERLGHLLDILRDRRGSYDAVALATRITPHIDTVELHRAYFGEGGPNPWGGVEAVLTHLVSSVLDVPAAHAPTMSSEAIRTESWGVVDPRKAAEVISTHLPVLRAEGSQQGSASAAEPKRRVRSVGHHGGRRFGPRDSGWLCWFADAGRGGAGDSGRRGSQQYEPDAERPQELAVPGWSAALRGELLRSGWHSIGDEGRRCSGDDCPADAADSGRARFGDRRDEWPRQRPCQWSHERPRERQDPSHEDDRGGYDQRFGNLGGGKR